MIVIDGGDGFDDSDMMMAWIMVVSKISIEIVIVLKEEKENN